MFINVYKFLLFDSFVYVYPLLSFLFNEMNCNPIYFMHKSAQYTVCIILPILWLESALQTT